MKPIFLYIFITILIQSGSYARNRQSPLSVHTENNILPVSGISGKHITLMKNTGYSVSIPADNYILPLSCPEKTGNTLEVQAASVFKTERATRINNLNHLIKLISMAIEFVVVERHNPADEQAPRKHYAQAKSSGELTFRDLGREVSEISSTVSDTDAMAVLNDLIKIMKRHLANGKIVRFGDFGSFRMTVSSEGAISEEAFKSNYIRSAKVNFSPGRDIKEMTRNATYKKVSK